MRISNELRSGRHCVFILHIHLVFVTKYRRGVITDRVREELKTIFQDCCNDLECELQEFDGEDDHVHLLVNYPPKLPVSKLVNVLKGVSSRLIRKSNHPEVRQKLWGGAFWSRSYFAGSCGGAPLNVIKQYIENQRKYA